MFLCSGLRSIKQRVCFPTLRRALPKDKAGEYLSTCFLLECVRRIVVCSWYEKRQVPECTWYLQMAPSTKHNHSTGDKGNVKQGGEIWNTYDTQKLYHWFSATKSPHCRKWVLKKQRILKTKRDISNYLCAFMLSNKIIFAEVPPTRKEQEFYIVYHQ